MESKIEKLEEFNYFEGRDALTVALDNTIIKKINEIIDHLNSQAQPEEKEMTKEDIEYLEKKREKEIQEGVAWLKQQEKEKMIPIKDEDINVGKLKELASDNYGKDAPEEKEELTKEEWFMLKLAVNEIHNKGNGAYDEISRKIDRLSKLKTKE